MKRRNLITLFVMLLSAAIVIAPLSACAGPAAPAAAKELKVGFITPSTGPAAEKGAPGGHGILDCVEYINTELGGVSGYKIKPLWYDSAYDMAKVVTIVKNLMDQGALLFTTHASAEMGAAKETANRAEFPGIATYNSSTVHRPPTHVYGHMPDYGDNWVALASYYVKNIWKGPGKPKMALHLLNNPTGYGARDGARAMAESLGIEIVATEEHTTTTTSEVESLTRIKAKNPDVIFISSTPAPTAVIIRNAKDLGLYPKTTILCAAASFTKSLIDIAGADIVEGVYGVFPTVTWDDNVPGLVKATEYVKKNNPKDYGNMDYLTTWSTTLLVAEVLKLSLQNTSPDVLMKGNVESWRAVEKNGIQKLKDFNPGGLHGPVTYVPGDNRLVKSLKLQVIKSGKIQSISDWVSTPLIKYEDYPWFK